MDTVRFGRALGIGARHAAKTLLTAADAATAPNPRATARPASPPPAGNATRAASANVTPAASPVMPPRSAAPSAAPVILPPASSSASNARRPRSASPHPAAQAATTARGLAEGSRRFGRAVWAPAVRLSGVLWLELTGVFFALFALVAGIAAWKLRSALYLAPSASAASEDRTRLLFAAGMVLVFGYFSLSSFLKARRRSRHP